MAKKELRDAVLAHANAQENYDAGWDEFVEGFTEDELDEFLMDCETIEQAMERAALFVEVRQDIRMEREMDGDEYYV